MAKQYNRRMLGKNLLCVVLAIGLTAAGIAQKPAAQAEKSYYPLALGNWWSYTVKRTSKKRTTVSKVWVQWSEEATFGPRSYQLSERPVTDDTPFFLGVRENGVVDPETGKVQVKNPLHTGDRWGQDAYETVSAGKPCVVGGHRFGDCATVREFSFNPRYGPIGLVRAVTYARGVGPVEYVYFNEHDPKKVDSTLTIRSWHVNKSN